MEKVGVGVGNQGSRWAVGLKKKKMLLIVLRAAIIPNWIDSGTRRYNKCYCTKGK